MLLIFVMTIWFISIVSFTFQFGFFYNKAHANDRETLMALKLTNGNVAAIEIFWAAFRADDSRAAGSSLRTRLRKLRVSAWAAGLSGIGILLSLVFPGVFEQL
ncbi:MAG TPA: hypothetical protein VMQ83_08315 [Gammaproteobacteria bacterium]|nr:hypothetical protein [Gammaproteobacteria bacterium]